MGESGRSEWIRTTGPCVPKPPVPRSAWPLIVVSLQPFLARFQKFLRPAVIQAVHDPLPPALLSGRMLAAKARKDNPDLLFRRIPLARRPADFANILLDRL